MKKWIVILALIATGVMAMNKEELKSKLFHDAQDKNATMDPNEAESLFKKTLQNRKSGPSLTKDEIIQFALDYAAKYPRNAGNYLDTALREVAVSKMAYFTGYPNRYEEARAKQAAAVKSFSWLKWVLYGLAGLAAVGVLALILKQIRKREER